MLKLLLAFTMAMGVGCNPLFAASSQRLGSDTVNIGNPTDVNKVLKFDLNNGSANPAIRGNNANGKVEFSQDGTNWKAIGSGSGGSGGINLLVDNPDFEAGISVNWTNSGGAYAAAGTPLHDLVSPTFNASAGSQYVRSDAYAIPAGLYSGPCLASVRYKTTENTNKYKLQVLDGTDAELATVDLDQSNSLTQNGYLAFACPASGSLKLQILSSGDAADITIDNAHLGSDTRLASVDVFNSLPFAKYTPTFGAGFGTVSSHEIQWRRVGDSIEIQGQFNSGTPTGSDASISLPTGLTAKVLLGGGQDYAVGEWVNNDGSNPKAKRGHLLIADGSSTIYFAVAEYTAATSGQTHQSGAVVATATSQIMWVNAKVRITGWSDRETGTNSVRVDQLGWSVNANISGSNIGLGGANVSSYTGITNSGLTLTNNSGAGTIAAEIPCSTTNPSTGTTCAVGDESVGVVFNLPSAGDVIACASFGHILNVTAGNATVAFQLVETSNTAQTVVQEGKSRIASDLNIASGNLQVAHPVRVCGNFNFTSAGQKTLRLMYEQTASGTVNTNSLAADAAAATGQWDIHWEVYPLNYVSGALPIFKGLVSRSATVQDGGSEGRTSVDSGTGTGATCTSVINTDSCATSELNYLRIGATVTGSFYLTIDPTTAATVQIRVAVPIASNFTASSQAAGSCTSAGLGYLRLLSNAANDAFEIEGGALGTTNSVYTCSFSYRVL